MTATDEFQVRNIVKTDLDQHFHNKPTFGPIVVHQESDEFGDDDGREYVRILIILDGDQADLDPEWTSGLIRRIRPKLCDIGVNEFPIPSFIEKNEWNNMFRTWRTRNPEVRIKVD